MKRLIKTGGITYKEEKEGVSNVITIILNLKNWKIQYLRQIVFSNINGHAVLGVMS